MVLQGQEMLRHIRKTQIYWQRNGRRTKVSLKLILGSEVFIFYKTLEHEAAELPQ